MPREYDVKLNNYNISKQRYFELKAKVRQYHDWKRLSTHSVGSTLDQQKRKRNITAVHTAVQEASKKLPRKQITPEMQIYLIDVLSGKETLTKMQTYYGVAVSKNTYYEFRRNFYYQLDKLVD